MNIVIYGINGRMGKVLLSTAQSKGFSVVAGIDKNNAPSALPVFPSLADFSGKADVIIDFSKPEALPDIVAYCTATKTPVVIASTGHSESEQKSIESLAKIVPVFMASNMSVGVYLLNELCKTAAKVLGDSCEVEIVEKHHNRKVDAPSGTALTLAKNINTAFQNSKTLTCGRTPESGKRKFEELCVHAVRGGTITGEHDVHFIMSDEVLTLSHSAQSPAIFALGALKAARFLPSQKPRLYGMSDL